MFISDDNCITCDSLESFLHLILNTKNDDIRKSTHLYYRGESRYNKYLVPNLYLDEGLTTKSSEYYYRMLLSQLGSADYNKSSELFRLMYELQHHGAKTRMLDISANPLIALYFATENRSFGDPENGYVYVFGSYHKEDRPDTNAEHFDVGHTVAVKTALNLISQDKINEFMNTCKSICSRISRTDWGQLRYKSIDSLPINSDEFIVIMSFMDILNQRAKTNEELVFPFKIYKELQLAHIVIPSMCTDRVKMHQGAFILPKYVNTGGESMESIQKEIDRSVSTLSANIVSPDGQMINVIKIPGEKKESIKRDLAHIGISEGFVYPDIEHRSNELLETIF